MLDRLAAVPETWAKAVPDETFRPWNIALARQLRSDLAKLKRAISQDVENPNEPFSYREWMRDWPKAR